jgi:hypothetical protein
MIAVKLPHRRNFLFSNSFQDPPTINPPKPQQSSMADDAPCALLCLIQGESVLFRVEPKRSVDIIELQKMIKEENSNRLQSVDASALTLWKVRMTIPSDSTTDSPAGRSSTPPKK